jgi:hypothetical protein
MHLTAFAARGVGVSLVLLSTLAHADPTKDACIDSNTNAQRLRLSGKFSGSRAELIKCSAPQCPAILREDCARRLDELEASQPTLVLDVKDQEGHDLTDVRVKVDGTVLTDRLNGTAEPVDPGIHQFTLEVAGQAPVTRTFVIKESEKGRRERIVYTLATSSDVAPVVAPHGSWSTQRWLGLGAGGLGVAGVIVGSVFGSLAAAAWNAQKSVCGSTPTCTSMDHASAVTDHDHLTTDGTASTAAFIAGGVLVAGGAVLFFTAPKARATSTGTLTVIPSLAPGRFTLGLDASF